MKYKYRVVIAEPLETFDTLENFAYRVLNEFKFVTKGEANAYHKHFTKTNEGTNNIVMLEDYKFPTKIKVIR